MSSAMGTGSPVVLAVLVLAFSPGVSDAGPESLTKDGIPRSQFRVAAETPDAESALHHHSHRRGRTLSPVQILNLPQPSCRYDSRRNGTCMQGSECIRAGGKFRADSMCNPARGAYVATCCLLEQTCGGIIRKNNTYFLNPDFPQDTTEPQTCDVAVAVGLASKKACYMRLDFNNFTTHDPIDGRCLVDAFSAPQMAVTIPKLCGYNNQSHMYIYVRDILIQQNVTLRMNLGEWHGPRHWMINVAFIDCGEDWAPPMRSCLQYNMASSDSMRSFNYNEIDPQKSAMLAGLHYTVCVRQDPTKCATKWTSNFFSLSASNQTTAIGDACQKNYVGISQGFNYKKQDKTYDRYCGEVFGSSNNSTNSSAVYSMAIPFNIQVHHSKDPKSLSRGFYLSYTQIQCGEPRSNEGRFSWLGSYFHRSKMIVES